MIAITCSILLPIGSRAANNTIALQPNADTFVKSSNPNRNYGDSTQLIADASPLAQSFLRFNVKDIGQNSVVQARLRLHVSDASDKAGIKVFSTATTWDEAAVTWNKQPALGPQVAALLPVAMPLGTWIEVDLGRAVTGDGAYSFALTTDTTNRLAFDSRTQTEAPQLVLTVQSDAVTTTPSP